jgi:hypothetical protein
MRDMTARKGDLGDGQSTSEKASCIHVTGFLKPAQALETGFNRSFTGFG